MPRGCPGPAATRERAGPAGGAAAAQILRPEEMGLIIRVLENKIQKILPELRQLVILNLPQKNSSRFHNSEMAGPIASGIQYLDNHLGNVVGRSQWYAKQDDAAGRARLGTVS